MGLILGGVSPQDLIMDGNSVSLWVGGNPPVKVWPTVVQITLGTFNEAQSQLRAALSDYGLDYRTVTEIPFGIELVGTGSAHGMFWDCSSLTTVPEMDTSNVTDMSYMFYGCSSLTHAPDMDTGNVTNMSDMFSGCSSLTHAPDMDTGNVTNMGGMFSGCSSLTYVPEMYTGHVTSMFVMFQNCSSLTDGNVRLIGRHPNVETAYMISGSGLTREPFYADVVQIPKAVDNSTSARDAFRAALTARGFDYKTITYLPFEIELVGSGNSVFDLFSNCSALQSVPSIPLPGVTTTRGMFHHCTSLTSVGDLYTSNVTNTMYMFWNCSSLTDGNVLLIGRHPSVETAVMISGSGLTRLPFDTEVHQVSLTNVSGFNRAHPLLTVTVPTGETRSVRIQGTVTTASSATNSQPVFRIGNTDSGRYGPGAAVDYSGTITSANSTIALVSHSMTNVGFVGTVTIQT